MYQPWRKYTAGSNYRYGFNGKDDDGETGWQDYGMRIYEPRLSKFLSVDPLTAGYPMLTPYQFASNSPIVYIDLDGCEGTANPETNTVSIPCSGSPDVACTMPSSGSGQSVFFAKLSELSNITYFNKNKNYKTSITNEEICSLDKTGINFFDYGGQTFTSALLKDQNGSWNWWRYVNNKGEDFASIYNSDHRANFVFQVNGEATLGIQASCKFKLNSTLNLNLDANLGNVTLLSGSAGYNSNGLNPGKWGAQSYYFGQGDQYFAKSNFGAGLTVNAPFTNVEFGLGGNIQLNYTKGPYINEGFKWSSDYTFLVSLQNKSAQDVLNSAALYHGNHLTLPASTSPKASVEAGKKDNFKGLDFGGKLALGLGLEGSIKIGFYPPRKQ